MSEKREVAFQLLLDAYEEAKRAQGNLKTKIAELEVHIAELRGILEDVKSDEKDVLLRVGVLEDQIDLTRSVYRENREKEQEECLRLQKLRLQTEQEPDYEETVEEGAGQLTTTPVPAPKPKEPPLYQTQDDDVVGIKQAAALTGISEATLYRRIQNGELPYRERQLSRGGRPAFIFDVDDLAKIELKAAAPAVKKAGKRPNLTPLRVGAMAVIYERMKSGEEYGFNEIKDFMPTVGRTTLYTVIGELTNYGAMENNGKEREELKYRISDPALFADLL